MGEKITDGGKRFPYHRCETQGTTCCPSIVFKVFCGPEINTDKMCTVISDLPLRGGEERKASWQYISMKADAIVHVFKFNLD